MTNEYLIHHGVKGQRWGVRRYQNYDGTLIKKKTKKAARYIAKREVNNEVLREKLSKTSKGSNRYKKIQQKIERNVKEINAGKKMLTNKQLSEGRRQVGLLKAAGATYLTIGGVGGTLGSLINIGTPIALAAMGAPIAGAAAGVTLLGYGAGSAAVAVKAGKRIDPNVQRYVKNSR